MISGLLWTLVVTNIVLLVMYLFLRNVFCWYWKINEQISLVQDTNMLIRTLVEAESLPDSEKKEFIIQRLAKLSKTVPVMHHTTPEVDAKQHATPEVELSDDDKRKMDAYYAAPWRVDDPRKTKNTNISPDGPVDT